MRKRLRIENDRVYNGTTENKLSILTLEVLLDIRDVLKKDTDVGEGVA